MKKTIKYEGTEEEKEKKAIEDCKFFWEEEHFKEITQEALPQVKDWRYGLCLLEFAGVTGYAAKVLLKKYSSAEEPQIKGNDNNKEIK